MDWQTITALGFVALTAAVFAYRLFRPAKKYGCGKNCGCGSGGESKVPIPPASKPH